MFNSITLKMKHGPSSTQLRADFIFPGTWDEFIGDDFYCASSPWADFTRYRISSPVTTI